MLEMPAIPETATEVVLHCTYSPQWEFNEQDVPVHLKNHWSLTLFYKSLSEGTTQIMALQTEYVDEPLMTIRQTFSSWHMEYLDKINNGFWQLWRRETK